MASTLLPRPLRRRSALLNALTVAGIVLLANVILSGLAYQVFIRFFSHK